VLACTYFITHSTEQRLSWEANRSSGSQEIPCVSWNPKVPYRIHKSPPPVPIRQIEQAHAPPPHFSKIHFNIIPSAPGSSNFTTETVCAPLPNTCYVLCLLISCLWSWHFLGFLTDVSVFRNCGGNRGRNASHCVTPAGNCVLLKIVSESFPEL
jgi:hypothetical protein